MWPLAVCEADIPENLCPFCCHCWRPHSFHSSIELVPAHRCCFLEETAPRISQAGEDVFIHCEGALKSQFHHRRQKWLSRHPDPGWDPWFPERIFCCWMAVCVFLSSWFRGYPRRDLEHRKILGQSSTSWLDPKPNDLSVQAHAELKWANFDLWPLSIEEILSLDA